MILGFYFILCFFLMIFQTTVLANLPVNAYDLLAPFVVYLAIYQGPRKALPVILFFGLMMDGLSGGIFGVYLTVYLWMYVGVRCAIQFLHVGNTILLPMLIIMGIFFECLVLAFCAVVLSPSTWPAEVVFSVLASQMTWAIFTGPLLVILFLSGQRFVERTRKKMVADANGSRDQ
jgi:rod shape-determining protein MreD